MYRHTGHEASPQPERHDAWKEWLQMVVTTPLTSWSSRSKHTGQLGSSTAPSGARDEEDANADDASRSAVGRSSEVSSMRRTKSARHVPSTKELKRRLW